MHGSAHDFNTRYAGAGACVPAYTAEPGIKMQLN